MPDSEPERKAKFACTTCGRIENLIYDLIPWRELSSHPKYKRSEWAALISEWDTFREPTAAELRDQMRAAHGWLFNAYYIGPEVIEVCSPTCAEAALAALYAAQPTQTPPPEPETPTSEQARLL